nr:probable Xaa-Pro aminopeptidase P isoform X1 [Tanacetum cinerariifolium]
MLQQAVGYEKMDVTFGPLTAIYSFNMEQFLFSFDAINELKETVAVSNLELVYLYDVNLVDEVWKEARPMPPNKLIRVHDLKHAGVDVSTKLSKLRSELASNGSSAIVISMLDDVAMLLKLQNCLLITVKSLLEDSIELRTYESILSEIKSLAARGAHIWLDTSSVNAAIGHICNRV